jgi:hypothetical protein
MTGFFERDASLIAAVIREPAARDAKITEAMRRLYLLAVREFGEEEARRRWTETAKKKGRRGPTRPRYPDKGEKLLRVYDAFAPDMAPGGLQKLPRAIAERAYRHDPKMFGPSPRAARSI